ncbi:PREDICTED: sulfite exporter TauE/SafE [Prunus dulcis]|uniref:PREDICTED: sulfite exporter TauE/SafE n=1 Tax=Prunus dulcis TaxID=3755 RepID=A0A5E4ESK8_PRUDU|nr:PREDICTED: sulfite exporter TauE/SafE [Prunus dulcis]
MVTGGAAATIFYNLRQRRPTIELLLIDHDLALLFQPMLVLGDGNEDVEDRNIPGGPSNGTTESKEAKKAKVSLLDSVCWKPFGVVAAVWVTIVALQIAVKHVTKCFSGILVTRCLIGGTVGGLLGLGGGFIMVHVSGDWDPSSAFYFAAAASLSAVRGQNFGGKVIKALGRTYLIIFILAFTTLGSTVSLALSSAAVSAHEEMLGSQPSSQNITGKEVQSHLGYNKHVWPASPIFYYLSWV